MSMENTMLLESVFLRIKLTPYFRAPERGEIIAFNCQHINILKNPFINCSTLLLLSIVSWTKRVIGIPGVMYKEKLKMVKTVVYVNGQKLDEPYVNQYPLLNYITRFN